MCGWTQSISAYSGDLNTEFDALQITLAKQFSKGFAMTGNYQWASAFDDNGGYSTWNKQVVHMRDSNVRDQQLVVYGSYDLPFGKGNQDCNHNVGGNSAPCRPNANGSLRTSLTSFNASSKTRTYWTAQPKSGGVFSFPGLDKIGNAGANTYFGPKFFNDDLALTKAFTIHENIATSFRMDAFN